MHFEPSSSRERVYIPTIVWLKRRQNGAESKSESGAVKALKRFYSAEEKYVIFDITEDFRARPFGWEALRSGNCF
jgi:hypothetical protein